MHFLDFSKLFHEYGYFHQICYIIITLWKKILRLLITINDGTGLKTKQVWCPAIADGSSLLHPSKKTLISSQWDADKSPWRGICVSRCVSTFHNQMGRTQFHLVLIVNQARGLVWLVEIMIAEASWAKLRDVIIRHWWRNGNTVVQNNKN